MTPQQQQSTDEPVPQTAFYPRDRILLYLSGLSLPDVDSLEIAAECLRRTGPAPDGVKTMQTLHSLLQEKGLGLPSPAEIARLPSFPPHNRTTMISRKLLPFGFFAWLKGFFFRPPEFDDLDENLPSEEGA